MPHERSIFIKSLVICFLAILPLLVFLPVATTEVDEPDLNRKEIIMLLAIAPNDGINLRGVNLTGLNLDKLNFGSSNLSGANLSHASLIGANLSNADLTGADLTGALLTQITLMGATMPDGQPYNDDTNLTDFTNLIIPNN